MKFQATHIIITNNRSVLLGSVFGNFYEDENLQIYE